MSIHLHITNSYHNWKLELLLLPLTGSSVDYILSSSDGGANTFLVDVKMTFVNRADTIVQRASELH